MAAESTDETTIETGETDLTVRRTVDASRERAFRAFTDPAELTAWFAPGEMTCEVHAFEPEPGGALALSHLAGDERYRNEGAFREVVADERLVFTWEWVDGPSGGETLVTVEFRGADGGTEVVLTHEAHPNADHVADAAEGWRGIFANLAAHLRHE